MRLGALNNLTQLYQDNADGRAQMALLIRDQAIRETDSIVRHRLISEYLYGGMAVSSDTEIVTAIEANLQAIAENALKVEELFTGIAVSSKNDAAWISVLGDHAFQNESQQVRGLALMALTRISPKSQAFYLGLELTRQEAESNTSGMGPAAALTFAQMVYQGSLKDRNRDWKIHAKSASKLLEKHIENLAHLDQTQNLIGKLEDIHGN